LAVERRSYRRPAEWRGPRMRPGGCAVGVAGLEGLPSRAMPWMECALNLIESWGRRTAEGSRPVRPWPGTGSSARPPLVRSEERSGPAEADRDLVRRSTSHVIRPRELAKTPFKYTRGGTTSPSEKLEERGSQEEGWKMEGRDEERQEKDNKLKRIEEREKRTEQTPKRE